MYKNANVKTSEWNVENDGAVGEIGFVLVWLVGLGGGGGYTIPQYTLYKNSDISLITRDSNRQMSHFFL